MKQFFLMPPELILTKIVSCASASHLVPIQSALPFDRLCIRDYPTGSLRIYNLAAGLRNLFIITQWFRLKFQIAKEIQSMKKLLPVALLTSLLPGYAMANSYTDRIPERITIHESGRVMFGTSRQPGNTCNNGSRYFRFDSSTEGGKAMLSTLLAAKATGSRVQIWYAPSTAPGTDCNTSSMAVVTSLGMP